MLCQPWGVKQNDSNGNARPRVRSGEMWMVVIRKGGRKRFTSPNLLSTPCGCTNQNHHDNVTHADARGYEADPVCARVCPYFDIDMVP